MNTKKFSLAMVSCLVLVNSFQILGSEQQKKERTWAELPFKDKVTLVGVAAVAVAGLYLGGLEEQKHLEEYRNYTTAVDRCVRHGSVLNCFDKADAQVPQSKQNVNVARLKEKVEDCMEARGDKRIVPSRHFVYSGWTDYKCEEGYFPDFQDAENACVYRLDQIKHDCFLQVVD